MTIANDRVLYVLVDGVILFFGLEWQHTASAVTDIPIRYYGKTATVYYTKVPDLTAATIESSCVFGTDWLEPLVSIYAEQVANEHLSQTSPSQGNTVAMSTWRMLQEQRKTEEALLAATRQQFLADMGMALQDRRIHGPRTRADKAWSGFKRAGRVSNPLTGVES